MIFLFGDKRDKQRQVGENDTGFLWEGPGDKTDTKRQARVTGRLSGLGV